MQRLITGGVTGAGLVVLLVCLGLSAVVFGPASLESSPAPQPTPADDDVALVREVSAIVKPLVDASAGAVTADTRTAHPPAKKSFADKAMLPGAILAGFGLVCLACVTIAVIFFMMRDRQIMTKLEIRKAELQVAYLEAQAALESK